MTRAVLVCALAVAIAPAVALAAPGPAPSPAITASQAGLRKAQQQQLHAQKMTKQSAANHIGANGGAHSDSNAPNNPGETSQIQHAANPKPAHT